MRKLSQPFPEDALATLTTLLRQTQDARVARRACIVRAVVAGQSMQQASETLGLSYRSVRKWVHRFATNGVQGLNDQPRSGRPRHVTDEIAVYIAQLHTENPTTYGLKQKAWSSLTLSRVATSNTGVKVSSASVRLLLHRQGETAARPKP